MTKVAGALGAPAGGLADDARMGAIGFDRMIGAILVAAVPQLMLGDGSAVAPPEIWAI